MEAQYKTRNGRLVFKIEGSGTKELLKGVAAVREVFDVDVVFRVRTAEGNDFFEIYCRSCHATLSYGQRKIGGGLWLKRLNENKSPLPNRGWSVYRGRD